LDAKARCVGKKVLVKALLRGVTFAATCNATDDESIARQTAELMLHTTYLATLQKVQV